MRKLLALMFALSAGAWAQTCHVVTPTGSGNNSGSDYNNACNGFNGACSGANLVRGDTYYVTKGTINFPTLSKADSGALMISIRATTAANFGQTCTPSVGAGFSAATHVGQTVSASVFASSGHWDINGVYGTEVRNTGKSSYGIKMNTSGHGGQAVNCNGAAGCSSSNFHFVEFVGVGSCAAPGGDVGIFTDNTGQHDILIEHSMFYNWNNDFKANGTTNEIIQNNVEYDNYSGGTCHGENMAAHAATNLTIRYNKVYDCVGTACFATPNGCLSTCAVMDNLQLYGNVFTNTRAGNCVDNGGTFECLSSLTRLLLGDNLTNAKYYNNTWVGWSAGAMVNGNQVEVFVNSSAVESGLQMKNNLFVNDGPINLGDDGGASCSSNSYFATTRNSTACSGDQVAAGNPLVSASGNGDFHLTSDTAAWTSLAAPFNTDPDGLTRTTSRGAFQFANLTFFITPTTINFGNVNVGSNSSVTPITLQNTGATTVNFASNSFIGANPGDFNRANLCGTSLAPGASCNNNITCSPTATGPRSATLRIVADTPNPGTPYDISLTCNGLSATPDATIAPTSIAFGGVTVGTTSSPTNLTLTNNSGATLNLTSITKTGTDPTQFGFTSTCGATLASLASCSIPVTCSPTSLGGKSANLVFTDNASSSPQTIPLTCTGATAPIIAFKNYTDNEGTGTAVSNLTTSGTLNIASGDTIVVEAGWSGTTVVPTGITCGADALTFVKRATGSPGTLDTWVKFGATPNAATACTVTWPTAVTFPMVAASSYSGLGGGSVDQTSCNVTTCNTQSTGTSRTAVNVTSTAGDELLVLGSWDNGGGAWTSANGYNLRSTNLHPGTLDYQMADKVVSTIGTYPSGDVATASSSSNYITTFVTLKVAGGGGGTPGAGVAPTNNNFGTVVTGNLGTPVTITLTNTGTALLTITSINLGGTNPTEFTQVNNCGGTLAAGLSCTNIINFAPSTVGLKTATLTFTDNATPSTQVVTLSGTGGSGPQPGASVSPSSVNFGNVQVGLSGTPTTVTLTNTGAATLNISSVTKGGTNPGDFSQLNSCGSTLGAGLSCTNTINCAPTTSGNRSATLTFTDNATPTTQTVTLSCAGFVAVPTVILGNAKFFGSGEVYHGPPPPSTVAQLPQLGVDNHECDAALNSPDLTRTIKASGGDYPATNAGFGQAVADMELQRFVNNLNIRVTVDSGSNFTITGGTQIGFPDSGYLGTNCIVFVASSHLRRGTQVGTVNIATIARASNVVTVSTLDPHGLVTSDKALIDGVVGGSTDFNVSADQGGTTVTVSDTTHFTYAQTGPDETGTVTFPYSSVTGPNTLAQQVAAPYFYKFNITVNNATNFIFGNGAHHWAFYDVEATTTAAQNDTPLMLFGNASDDVHGLAGQAFHLGLMQFYIHGCTPTIPTTIPVWPQPIPCAGTETKVKNALRFLCAYCYEGQGMTDQIAYLGVESHSSGTFAAQGPIKIFHNHLRGGSTTVHFGGTAPTITGLVPSDIEIRNNIIDVDPNWQVLTGCNVVGGRQWTMKNRVEFKNAQRVIFSGNRIAYSWCDGQTGSFLLLTVRGDSYWTRSSDITLENNYWTHGTDWMQLNGRDNASGGSGMSMPGQKFLIRNNLVTDIANTTWAEGTGATKIVPLNGNGQDYTCNATRTAGVATLSSCACISTAPCPFTGVTTGDMVHTTACTDPSFNASRNALAISSNPFTIGPLTYPSAGSDVASGVTCNLNNTQGWPAFITVDHNTVIEVGNVGSGTRNLLANTAPNGGADNNTPRSITYKNNMIARLGTSGPNWFFCTATSQDGTISTKGGACLDTPSFAFHHMALFGATLPNLANYTEYNPAGTEGPLSTVAIKLSAICGGPPTANCAGFTNDLSTAADTQYHNYKLLGTSFYHAGNAGQGDDAKDLGADFSELDAALVANKYICRTTCGTGFYPEYKASTTIVAATANNTTTCTAAGAPIFCTAGFTPITTNVANATAITVTTDPAPGNANINDARTWMYTGASSKVLFHYQDWWGCSGHLNIGQASPTSSSLIAATAASMIRYGGYGVVVDWAGNRDATKVCRLANTNAWASYLTTNFATVPLRMGMMVDGAGLTAACPIGATDRTACLTTELNAELDYVNTNYAGQAWYLLDGTSPVVMFFINEADWSGTTWATVWSSVKTHTNAFTVPFKFVFEATQSHVQSDGGFAWMANPQVFDTTKQLWWGDSAGLTPAYYNTFYAACLANPTKICVGMVKKGFDDGVGFGGGGGGLNRVQSQRCGQTIRDTAALIGTDGYSSATQLGYVGIPWNDYEEGTEMETGVDNCYTISSSLSGDILSWALVVGDATYSTTTTVDHFRVWYGTSTSDLKLAQGNIPLGITSLNVKSFVPPGTWNLYVQMVGKPFIINRMSGAQSYSGGTSN